MRDIIRGSKMLEVPVDVTVVTETHHTISLTGEQIVELLRERGVHIHGRVAVDVDGVEVDNGDEGFPLRICWTTRALS